MVLFAALAGGQRWWKNVDRAYASEMFRPFHVRTHMDERAGVRVLSLVIDDERWRGRRWSPLIPDHGKLMHLFLVHDRDMDVFAHLHPVMRDSSHFESALPPLPAGLYRVYGDIVHESGFAQTLSDSVRITAPAGNAPAAPAGRVLRKAAPAWPASDPDDSWFTGVGAPDTSAVVRFVLADGATAASARMPARARWSLSASPQNDSSPKVS